MGEKELYSELERLYRLAQDKPQQLLGQIEVIRSLKSAGKEIPKEYQVLADFVYPKETLLKRGFSDFLLMDEYSLSYATPQKYGAYRAKKIAQLFAGEDVVDISCGSGAQLIELCKEMNAFGIEKDPLRFWLTKINTALAYGLEKIPMLPVIYNEDALNSLRTVPLVKEIRVILCDSWRESGKYLPDIKQLKDLYPGHYLVYEFRPLEKASELLMKYPFLFGKCELEYYGEGDRCSRLTAYVGRGKMVSFVQEDVNLNLNYSHERAESVETQTKEKLVSGFPGHDFILLNRCLVEQGFISLFNFPVFHLDKKRFLAELNSQLKSSRVFSPVLSTNDIQEVTAYLQDNYNDYNVTLRLDIPNEEYWNFAKENKLVVDRQSQNRFSLFKQKNIFLLAEEK
jgi:hypothetical protein